MIHLALLNGYRPAWVDALGDGIRDVLPGPVRDREMRLDFGPAFAPDRGQYHATFLLGALLRTLPAPEDKVLGVTAVDLFVPVLTFVFGQAQLAGSAAVLSTCRLQNEFYGLAPDEGLLLERAIKEAVHELGHAHGLVHCPDYRCVMHASTHVEDVDLKGAAYCGGCGSALERSASDAGA